MKLINDHGFLIFVTQICKTNITKVPSNESVLLKSVPSIGTAVLLNCNVAAFA